MDKVTIMPTEIGLFESRDSISNPKTLLRVTIYKLCIKLTGKSRPNQHWKLTLPDPKLSPKYNTIASDPSIKSTPKYSSFSAESNSAASQNLHGRKYIGQNPQVLSWSYLPNPCTHLQWQ